MNKYEWFLDYFHKGKELISLRHAEQAAFLSSVIQGNIDKGQSIFAAGNGGSLMNAQHFIQDLFKGVREKTDQKPKAFALGSNQSLLSALSNDISYDDVFRFELEGLAKPGDTLFVLSVSGNSQNILRAIDWAIENEVFVVALIGFNGNNLIGDGQHHCLYKVVFDDEHFGRVEDSMSSFLHSLVYFLADNNEDYLMNKYLKEGGDPD